MYNIWQGREIHAPMFKYIFCDCWWVCAFIYLTDTVSSNEWKTIATLWTPSSTKNIKGNSTRLVSLQFLLSMPGTA
jgi:hypothetical protein